MSTPEQLKNKRGGRKNITTRPAFSHEIYGKVPPQARELEDAVIGAILIERDSFELVNHILRPECFYRPENGLIFKAAQNLHAAGTPIDMLTICEQLKINEELEQVGGPYAITIKTNSVTSASNIEAHAKFILKKYTSREVIRICNEGLSEAFEDFSDADTLQEDIILKLSKITDGLNVNSPANMIETNTEFINDLAYKIANKEQISGVPSGYKSIDEITYGWQQTDLIILAARPSVGKTALAVRLARNAAMDPVKPTPTVFFSLEMSKGQLMERIVAAETEIPLRNIRRGQITQAEYDRITGPISLKLERAKLFIDDAPTQNWMDIRRKCMKLKRDEGIGLIIIDYLQLMSDVDDGVPRNREQQISNISRNLKKLAKELKVPIIALSQLSRMVETRGAKDKVPQLSDLRESGAIEQDADLVAFIYKPEVVPGKTLRPGETHIRIAKHRNGNLETIKLIAKLYIQNFYEMEDPKLENLKNDEIPFPVNTGTPVNFDDGFTDADPF